MSHESLHKQAIATADAMTDILIQKGIDPEVYPRNLEYFANIGFEIPVIYRSDLTLQSARDYVCALAGNSLRYDQLEQPDRRLFGLLHIGPPTNVILVRAGLLPHIINFVIAHEVGHFVAEIFLLQQLWQRSFPERIEEIVKAFSWHEFDPRLELRALVRGLPERPTEITARGKETQASTIEREILADLIACELIAPWHKVTRISSKLRYNELVDLLCNQFGLPYKIASDYAEDVLRKTTPRKALVDTLFSPLLDKKSSKKR